MALTLRTNGSGVANIVTASWWDDFYNLLTGVMSDQPVTIANNLTANTLLAKGAAGNAQLYTSQSFNVAALQYLYQPASTPTGFLFQTWNGTAQQNLFSIGTTNGSSYLDSTGNFSAAGSVKSQGNLVGEMVSAGGGASGVHIWVGTTDPAGSASEGDIWVVG